MSLQRIETTQYTDDILLAEAFAKLDRVTDPLDAGEDLSLSKQYWLKIAPPDELADYIVRQPDHTWNGLTIYPDEAWRYRHNDLWITWRNNQNELIHKLNRAKKFNLMDWDEEWYSVVSSDQTHAR